MRHPPQGQPYPGQPHPQQPYPGQTQPGQPYPGQPYPGQPGGGGALHPGGPPQGLTGIRLHIQGSVLTNSLIAPKVVVDHQLQAKAPTSGMVDLPTPPGPRHLRISAQWMREYGQAEMVVDVPPGQLVDVFYNGPYHQFTTGSIGLVPQPKKGVGVLIGAIAGSVLLVLLVFVVAFLLTS